MKLSKILIITIFFLQGLLMGAVLKQVEVNGVSVPVIFEKDSSLPALCLSFLWSWYLEIRVVWKTVKNTGWLDLAPKCLMKAQSKQALSNLLLCLTIMLSI